MPPIITLCSDFGHRDAYAGVMKGVILAIAPEALLVDLTHGLPPQDLVAGALVLESAVPYFPRGTVHLAVVDPGVGTRRRAVALRCGGQFLVGPDNGLLELALARLRAGGGGGCEAVVLENPACRLHPLSHTFHGRDLFAPAAAHLAAGLPLEELGPAAGDLEELGLPAPRWEGPLLCRGAVLAADRFGNLVTNLVEPELRARVPAAAWEGVNLELSGLSLRGLRRTFADVEPGCPVAYLGSGGRLEMGIRDGSLAAETGAGPGDGFTLEFG